MRFFNFSILIIALAVLGFSIKAKADAENYGYRVTSSSKTVIQIARDVYNDERLWKKISYWNNITPPYSLSVGQVLVLPYTPVNQLPKENLVVGSEVPSPNFMKNQPSVTQEIIKNSGYYTYFVNERAPSLTMVALENYGNKKMAPVIAKWNGLAKDAKLNLGQSLKLKVKPTLPAAEATAILINHWAKLGNEEMVLRLGGKSDLVIRKDYTPTVRAKSQIATATPAPISATPTPTETALTAATSALTTATSALTAATSALTAATTAQTAPTPAPEKTTHAQTAATPAPAETTPAPTAATPAPGETTPTPTAAIPAPAETVPAPTAATSAPAEIAPVPTTATPTPTETAPNPTAATTTTEAEAKVKPETEKQRAPATNLDNGNSELGEPTEDSYWLGSERSKILRSIEQSLSTETKK